MTFQDFQANNVLVALEVNGWHWMITALATAREQELDAPSGTDDLLRALNAAIIEAIKADEAQQRER